jgi:hypothetical protein
MKISATSLILLFFAVSHSYAAPEADLSNFRKSVLPLLSKYCMDCHDADTKKGSFDLESLAPNMLSDDDVLEQWRLVEEQLHFDDMPPEKKQQPSADEKSRILQWVRSELFKTQRPDHLGSAKLHLPQFGNYVDHGTLFGKRFSHVIPARPRIWRLRPTLYNGIMPRLGEKITGLANGLNLLDGPNFKDYAAPYFLDEAATAPLLSNAKKIAAALVGQNSRDKIFKELVKVDATPSPQLVEESISLAFRKIVGRGPTAEETERFQNFHAKATKTGGHVTAGKALLTAVLLQPEVLYRSELGKGDPDEFGRIRLSSREIAYALSYSLDNQPIREFLDASSQGDLSTSKQVAELVAKRLKDDSLLQDKNPRIIQFFREYFNYPYAREVFKDQPDGGKHDAGRLVADLETMIRDIIRNDEDVLHSLLTSRNYYVNAEYRKGKDNKISLHQAHHKSWPYQTSFNLPHDWKWSLVKQPVAFPRNERAGVLTHPAWLAAWSGNFENHPVQRGKWIRTHLLGGTVPDVPIGVDALVPEKKHTSFRDRLITATASSKCQRCHRKMDPLGLPFERYDHYGRIQRLDAGQPVDPSGAISRTRFPNIHGKFTDPVTMIDHLAASEKVEQVFVRHVFRFFMGRNETLGDANTLQDAYKAYLEAKGSFSALIISLLSSDSFLLRQQSRKQS